MANDNEKFNWHIAQATYHTNAAINLALSNHRVGLSDAERTALEGVQSVLEALESRS